MPTNTDQNYLNLIVKVIYIAMRDYLNEPCSRASITKFFQSSWGKNLLEAVDYPPSEKIIEKVREYAKNRENESKLKLNA